MAVRWGRSNFGAFGKRERVLHIRGQLAHNIFDYGVTEQEMRRAGSGCLVDDRYTLVQ